jgi:hypothetical protein
VFVYTTNIHYSYDANKADCKNGGEHNLTSIHRFPEAFGVGKRLCRDCGVEIVVDQEAHDNAVKKYFEEIKDEK